MAQRAVGSSFLLAEQAFHQHEPLLRVLRRQVRRRLRDRHLDVLLFGYFERTKRGARVARTHPDADVRETDTLQS